VKKVISLFTMACIITGSALLISCDEILGLVLEEEAATEASRVPDEDYTGTREGLFTGKFSSRQIHDVQREPIYPVAGKKFTLYDFKGIFDSSISNGNQDAINNKKFVNWGTKDDRYVMFNYVGTYSTYSGKTPDNAKDAKEEYCAGGDPVILSMKLYEADGTFVKSISKYGFVWGIGKSGFMFTAYDNGNDLGSFTSTQEGFENGDTRDLSYVPTRGLVTNRGDLDSFGDVRDTPIR